VFKKKELSLYFPYLGAELSKKKLPENSMMRFSHKCVQVIDYMWGNINQKL
jgi:hypothetical protein